MSLDLLSAYLEAAVPLAVTIAIPHPAFAFNGHELLEALNILFLRHHLLHRHRYQK